MALEDNNSSPQSEVTFTDVEMVYHLTSTLSCARRENDRIILQNTTVENEVKELRLVQVNQDKLYQVCSSDFNHRNSSFLSLAFCIQLQSVPTHYSCNILFHFCLQFLFYSHPLCYLRMKVHLVITQILSICDEKLFIFLNIWIA